MLNRGLLLFNIFFLIYLLILFQLFKHYVIQKL